jgi:hypothetical protein
MDRVLSPIGVGLGTVVSAIGWVVRTLWSLPGRVVDAVGGFWRTVAFALTGGAVGGALAYFGIPHIGVEIPSIGLAVDGQGAADKFFVGGTIGASLVGALGSSVNRMLTFLHLRSKAPSRSCSNRMPGPTGRSRTDSPVGTRPSARRSTNASMKT